MNKEPIKMKPSGVEWIGNVPSDWIVEPLFRFFDVSKDKIDDGAVDALSVGYMGVVPQLENAAKNVAGGERKHVLAGDVVINSRSDRMGAAGLASQEGGVSLVYHVLRPRHEVNGRFFHYMLRNVMFSQEFYRRGNGIVADLWSTKDSELKRIAVPVPPSETQQKIVDFLDRKTAEVDGLIEKKKRMIELLKEKRTSIITHAVTKGLDPHAKMKDSGVEWIGETPEGWEVKRHKFLFSAIIKKGSSDNKLSLENIESWTGKYIETESEYGGDGVFFSLNDIVFGKLRPYLAKVYLANCEGEALGDLLVYRSKGEIQPKFGQLMHLSKNFIDYLNGSSYGTKMPRVDPAFIQSLHMIYPSVAEQIRLVEHIETECDRIDSIIDAVRRQIEHLVEYRNSLIYHAVTGKMSV